jgi:hypothetical protein
VAAKKKRKRTGLSRRRLLTARKALVRLGAKKYKGMISDIDWELAKQLEKKVR